ncbi:energy transducer TonB family protein [Acanthopleuribacter pedis]|uniref:TonB family protein n=1 Tax=Acanthopleuribacter pedis TaxID=442870 RepID=A0A8J7Q6F2_9BACT|nr:energy transducer TonB [Acanthopleuribacter pedis]MBO1317554.1 TonB family protein [Acanthopleuribacter pedis]
MSNTTSTYQFREEAKPRFTFKKAMVPSLLVLLLLFLGFEQAQPFALSKAEQARLQEEAEELSREMTFRFVDAPADPLPENPEARFFSDANRELKSQETPEEEPDSDDPASTGNSFELEQAAQPSPQSQPTPPTPASPNAVAAATQPPLPEPEPEPAQETTAQEEGRDEQENELPDEPVEVEGESEAFDQGQVPTAPGAPKPYRPLSKQERQEIREKAKREMSLQSALSRQQTATPAGGNRYHNPRGRSTPKLGFSIDTAGHDLGPYLRTLTQLVRSNWRVPTIAQFEVSGVTVIGFKLHKDGRITDAVVLKQSEHQPLDVSALNAITNTYKAPPLPDHIDEPYIPIKFAFYFNMRPAY